MSEWGWRQFSSTSLNNRREGSWEHLTWDTCVWINMYETCGITECDWSQCHEQQAWLTGIIKPVSDKVIVDAKKQAANVCHIHIVYEWWLLKPHRKEVLQKICDKNDLKAPQCWSSPSNCALLTETLYLHPPQTTHEQDKKRRRARNITRLLWFRTWPAHVLYLSLHCDWDKTSSRTCVPPHREVLVLLDVQHDLQTVPCPALHGGAQRLAVLCGVEHVALAVPGEHLKHR